MRLRLTVQRNSLPDANILWSVPETNSPQAYTITRLLEDVNLIIPLEAEHWGLEHYVVEVGGFECLHFSPVSQALKEDDHVSIRPLMTAEVRARTLTGRDQISDDGRHLVDGIPFGRPYLKRPHRPAVRIPPPKPPLLDYPGSEEDVALAGLLTSMFSGGEASEELESGSKLVSRGQISQRVASKSVQFQQPGSDEEDDSEEDDDFAMDDESEDDSDSDAESDASSSGSDSSDYSDLDTSSDSGSDGESEAGSPPDVRSSKDGSTKHIPPGEGRPTTKTRNARRTMTNRLRHLKKAGELHENANLSDLRKYEDEKKGIIAEAPQTKPFSTSSGKRKRLDNDESGEGVNEDGETTDEFNKNKKSTEVIPDDISELEQRKRDLMARFGHLASSNTVQGDEPVQLQPPVVEPAAASPPQNVPSEEPLTKKVTPSKRLRPDTTAISRILARQAARPAAKKAKTKPTIEEPPEPEGASDPDFWKSRINLSAFECWEEDFELTAPPFPFQQHWDPASKLMREKASNKKKGKRGKKSGSRESLPAEEEDEEEQIILDYDDAPATENPDADINAAIEDQLRQDVAIAVKADLPLLPDDISTLPDLTSSDIKEGAVIVCKFFAVNPITITPEISDYKTAVVEREGDSGNGAGTIRLKIAERDLPKREKKFDSKGNRIYDAGDGFFMGDDDDDEDEDLWEGQFSELLEPKLLRAV